MTQAGRTGGAPLPTPIQCACLCSLLLVPGDWRCLLCGDANAGRTLGSSLHWQPDYHDERYHLFLRRHSGGTLPRTDSRILGRIERDAKGVVSYVIPGMGPHSERRPSVGPVGAGQDCGAGAHRALLGRATKSLITHRDWARSLTVSTSSTRRCPSHRCACCLARFADPVAGSLSAADAVGRRRILCAG